MASSLSSLLLPTSSKGTHDLEAQIDQGLDDIFKSTKAPIVPLVPSLSSIPPLVASKGKKRKNDEAVDSQSKRSKGATGHSDSGKSKKKVSFKPVSRSVETNDSGDDNEGTANSKARTKKVKEPETISEASDVDAPIEHESLSKGKPSKETSKKAKHTPDGETKEQKDARTIFVGNLSNEVAKSKSSLKALLRHITAFAPYSKVESTRFRSIAFKSPTAQLEDPDKPKPSTSSTKLVRQQERAASWRSEKDGEEEAADASVKIYQKPSEKKKVAFIKRDFHQEADTCNAYIVFAYPSPDRAPNVPPTLDPFHAAKLISEKANGTTFMDRTLRVDRVGKDGTASSSPGGDAVALRDPKRTVFVGNLDFAAKEQDLRVFFEGLVSADRGPCTLVADEEESEQDGEEPMNSVSWVRSVRIVRDKDTQVGKGFGYVLFADRQCVDEIVAMDETKLRFAKRKLRVSRCKTTGTASTSKPAKRSSAPAPATSSPMVRRPPATKGDPALGDRIKHLSKDARKDAKASDITRVQRRLEKKKLRMQMERSGLPNKGMKKDRSRIRKPVADGKPTPAKKSRIRSEKSIGKRNAKK